MSDIAGIEVRLDAALSRISEGVDKLSTLPLGEEAAAANDKQDNQSAKLEDAEQEIVSLRAELAREKNANAELSERIETMQDKHKEALEQLQNRTDSLQKQSEAQSQDVVQLRNANAELRRIMQALREAAAEGEVGDEVLNQALKSELEATRTQQTADRHELDAILAELTPLIQEKADV